MERLHNSGAGGASIPVTAGQLSTSKWALAKFALCAHPPPSSSQFHAPTRAGQRAHQKLLKESEWSTCYNFIQD